MWTEHDLIPKLVHDNRLLLHATISFVPLAPFADLSFTPYIIPYRKSIVKGGIRIRLRRTIPRYSVLPQPLALPAMESTVPTPSAHRRSRTDPIPRPRKPSSACRT